MLLFLIAVIIFVFSDILIRFIGKKIHEKNLQKERSAVLDQSLKLDYSKEAPSLKRVDVENPKAKILCIDDEMVILDSFRKILVMDGYSIDTVLTGPEALGLIQTHHYDFVFTDLKMPDMDGIDVTKAVKHLRPDIDVIIITGYATVESAVECMKFGAMDYIQKPFTEDELLDFIKKFLIKRQERIQKQLKPRVHIMQLSETKDIGTGEFAIPGGVFISKGHCWANVQQSGSVKIGIDDFAKKLIGNIHDIEYPNLGMQILRNQPLFYLKQKHRKIPFLSPISGKVTAINPHLVHHTDELDINPYGKNWICSIDADNLDTEIKDLYIGKTAVSFYQDDIEQYRKLMKNIVKTKQSKPDENIQLYIGELEEANDQNWETIVNSFFKQQE